MSAPPTRGHRWRLALALIVGGVLALALLLTSSEPAVPDSRHATAEQVAAARALVNQARQSRATGEPVELTLAEAELAATSAMVTQGFAPNRFDARVEDGVLTLTGSRPMLFRWINIRAQASGASEGLPTFAVKIGALPLPDWFSQWGLALIQRRMAAQGGTLPPIDTIVRSMRIGPDSVTARVLMPQGSLLAHARTTGVPAVDEDMVGTIYCALAQRQRGEPAPLLAQQLRRALAASQPSPEGHSAALVALALFSLGPEAAELFGGVDGTIGTCAARPVTLTLQGRADWAKHWALSAALETTTGSSISAAIGEWKELADSLESDPLLAPKDPSGFSFVDLASDRSGIKIARRLTDPERMADTRAALLGAQDEDLLPAAALALSDGLTDAEFAARYGATDDPRYERKVASIDAMLRRGGID